MTCLALYLNAHAGEGDPAIIKALRESGYDLMEIHSIADVLQTYKARIETGAESMGDIMVLVAEIQAGAISLMTLMREKGYKLPPTLILDREGTNIIAAVEALKLGATDYVLLSEQFSQRELRARLLAERLKIDVHAAPTERVIANGSFPHVRQEMKERQMRDFEWMPDENIIRCDGSHVQLSPAQGRIFSMLMASHMQTVSNRELIDRGLMLPSGNMHSGPRLLRPHIRHLRERLNKLSRFSHRIVTVRNNGYVLI